MFKADVDQQRRVRVNIELVSAHKERKNAEKKVRELKDVMDKLVSLQKENFDYKIKDLGKLVSELQLPCAEDAKKITSLIDLCKLNYGVSTKNNELKLEV
ncbi:hypothetical protein AgCh_028152 [Apium graveolens]